MKRVTFGLGQGLDAHGHLIPGLTAKRNKAFVYLASTFGGFNAVDGTGGYIGAEGLALEISLTVSVYTSDVSAVESAAEYLRALFLQESVMVAVEHVESLEFVAGQPAERVAA